jgi:hypothetical protein
MIFRIEPTYPLHKLKEKLYNFVELKKVGKDGILRGRTSEEILEDG